MASHGEDMPVIRDVQQCSASSSLSGDDSTIVASDEEVADMAEMDNDGFKVVSHRKHRTVGIPVIVQPKEKGVDFREWNPIRLFDDIKVLLGSAPIRSRFTTQGALHLDISTEEQVDILLRCSQIGGIRVQARLPHSYMTNTCVIRGSTSVVFGKCPS